MPEYGETRIVDRGSNYDTGNNRSHQQQNNRQDRFVCVCAKTDR